MQEQEALVSPTSQPSHQQSAQQLADSSLSVKSSSPLNLSSAPSLLPDSLTGAASTSSSSYVFVHGGSTKKLPISSINFDLVKNSLPPSECLNYLSSNLYILNLSKRQWTILKPAQNSPIPQPRLFHSIACYKNYLLLFGGIIFDKEYNCLRPSNDLWSFDLNTNIWQLLSTGLRKDIPTPRPRFGHTIVCNSKIPASSIKSDPLSTNHPHDTSNNNQQKKDDGLPKSSNFAGLILLGGKNERNENLCEFSIFDFKKRLWVSNGTDLIEANYKRDDIPQPNLNDPENINKDHKLGRHVDSANVPCSSDFSCSAIYNKNSSTIFLYSRKFIDEKKHIFNSEQPLISFPFIPTMSSSFGYRSPITKTSPNIQDCDLINPSANIFGDYIIISGTSVSTQKYCVFGYHIPTGTWNQLKIDTSVGKFWGSFLWKSHHKMVLIGGDNDSSYASTPRSENSNSMIDSVEKDEVENNFPFTQHLKRLMIIDLTAHGIVAFTPSIFSEEAVALGKDVLHRYSKYMSDFEIKTASNTSIPASMKLLRSRWGKYFETILLKAYNSSIKKHDSIALTENFESIQSSGASIGHHDTTNTVLPSGASTFGGMSIMSAGTHGKGPAKFIKGQSVFRSSFLDDSSSLAPSSSHASSIWSVSQRSRNTSTISGMSGISGMSTSSSVTMNLPGMSINESKDDSSSLETQSMKSGNNSNNNNNNQQEDSFPSRDRLDPRNVPGVGPTEIRFSGNITAPPTPAPNIPLPALPPVSSKKEVKTRHSLPNVPEAAESNLAGRQQQASSTPVKIPGPVQVPVPAAAASQVPRGHKLSTATSLRRIESSKSRNSANPDFTYMESVSIPRVLYMPFAHNSIMSLLEFFHSGTLNPNWKLSLLIDLFFMGKYYQIPLLYHQISTLFFGILTNVEWNLFESHEEIRQLNVWSATLSSKKSSNEDLLKIKFQKKNSVEYEKLSSIAKVFQNIPLTRQSMHDPLTEAFQELNIKYKKPEQQKSKLEGTLARLILGGTDFLELNVQTLINFRGNYKYSVELIGGIFDIAVLLNDELLLARVGRLLEIDTLIKDHQKKLTQELKIRKSKEALESNNNNLAPGDVHQPQDHNRRFSNDYYPKMYPSSMTSEKDSTESYMDPFAVDLTGGQIHRKVSVSSDSVSYDSTADSQTSAYGRKERGNHSQDYYINKNGGRESRELNVGGSQRNVSGQPKKRTFFQNLMKKEHN